MKTNKEILKEFMKSLYRDGWLNIDFEENSNEFDEWFEHQYRIKLFSFERKQLEENSNISTKEIIDPEEYIDDLWISSI